MKRKLISAVLVLLMVMVLIPWSAMAASSGSCGSGVKWTLDSAGTLTISGKGKMKDFDSGVPWKVENVRKVVIKNGVTSIGNGAFMSCKKLTSVSIADSVTSIGDGAFFICWNLKEITLPSKLTHIGETAFRGCNSLTSVTIPDGVEVISGSAFADCDVLTNVKLPKNLKEIGTDAFELCKQLKSIDIPEGTTIIRMGAFAGCSNLTQVTLPSTLEIIEDNVFAGCGFSTIKLPDSMKEIGRQAFSACENLTSLTIPEGIETLHYYTFTGCPSLKTLKLPSTLKEIDGMCVAWSETYCGIETLIIPASVERISYSSFYECKNLKAIYFEGDRPEMNEYVFEGLKNTTIYYPDGNKTWTSDKTEYIDCKLTWKSKLPTPTVKAESSTSGVKVSWNKITGAKNYTVYRKVPGGSWKAIKSGVTGTSYTDKTAVEGNTYAYTVRAVCGQLQSSFKSSNAVTYLKIPTVKVANAASGVMVTWNKIASADSYKVYRKVSGGSWVAIKSGLTGTSYTDTKAAAGKTYSYTVRAVKGSALSGFVSSSAIKRLTQPTVKAANATTGVKVTWGKITGASSYTVYRSTDNKSWTALKKGLTTTSYTDTTAPTGTFYYTVRAVSGSSASSYKGSSAVKFVKIPTAKVASVHNGIKITWSADKAADSFRVYRKVSGGSWVGLKSGLKGTSYTDTTAKSGKTYYYTVKAVKGSLLSGYKSTAALKYFAAPAISAVQSVDSGIKITWNKVSGAEKYELYQSINGGAYTKLTTTTGTSYTSKATASPVDKIYSFKVRAVKGTTQSGYSAVKQTPYLPTPKVTCEAVDDGIEVDWDMDMSAEKYQVYRKTTSGSWKKIATIAVSHYTDTTAVKGTTYYYTVKSLRTLNGETLYSSFKSSSAVKRTK